MRRQALRYLYWTCVRLAGALILYVGDWLYWAGKQGQRRNDSQKG